jgi:hypothetical protein
VLNRLKKSWDDAATELKKPGAVETLSTMGELSDAVSWYDQAMQRASQSELGALAQQRAAYEQKLAAMKRVTTIQEQQESLSELQNLSGKQLKMELELVGLDQIKSNIRSLQKMLEDTKNPLGDTDRTAVQQQITSWKSYEKQLKKSQVTYKDAWSSTKSVGSGVESITEALKSDGNAWDKVTGLVDGAISVFDGISGIVKMVQTMTGATKEQTTAQTANTTATSINAVAQEEQAAASGKAAAGEGANTGVMEGEAQAAQTDATAQILLAGSKTMAAHASIPFVGIAIAGGLIATMTAIMLALPKFANGGIAYGPTLGLFGEYAGASTNPEVVAPLSKLRELIGSDGGGNGGEARIRLRAKGRDLVGVYEREQRFRGRQ